MSSLPSKNKHFKEKFNFQHNHCLTKEDSDQPTEGRTRQRFLAARALLLVNRPKALIFVVKMSKSDNSGTFLELQTLIEEIASTSKHTDKTKVIGTSLQIKSLYFNLTIKAKFLKTFTGDVYRLFHLLLCRDDKRAYNGMFQFSSK